MYRSPSSSLIAVELGERGSALVEAPTASLGDPEHVQHVGLERAQTAGPRQLQTLGREGDRLAERGGSLDQAHRERERDRVQRAACVSTSILASARSRAMRPCAARPSYIRASPTSRQASASALRRRRLRAARSRVRPRPRSRSAGRSGSTMNHTCARPSRARPSHPASPSAVADSSASLVDVAGAWRGSRCPRAPRRSAAAGRGHAGRLRGAVSARREKSPRAAGVLPGSRRARRPAECSRAACRAPATRARSSIGRQLDAIAVGLLEVIGRARPRVGEPRRGSAPPASREALVQLGPVLLRQRVVGGVADQRVPEGEAALAGSGPTPVAAGSAACA